MGVSRYRNFEWLLITDKANHWKAVEWCEQQFGARWSAINNRSGTWCCFWAGRKQPESYEWRFQNEQDALLFSLR
jgi:hypothetical protein